jgi:sulfite reductase (ferredoxin)
MSEEVKLSAVEGIKDQSNFLRGTIAEELKSEADHFAKDSLQLLKFHGTYQQDNREQRIKNAEGKSVKVFTCMVRSRIPGGKMTSDQLLAHLDIADELGTSTLKITTRQALQLHGIPKNDLRQTIRRINDIHLSTLAACGDVNRNVMCCPAPLDDGLRGQLQTLADDLAEHLAPKSRSYFELWLTDEETGEKTLVGGDQEDYEPIYGKVYLPRKFKIGIALPDDNCIDVYTQDLGYIGVVKDGRIVGYNVIVGGGFGNTPSAKKTFPALAKRMAFVTPEQAVGVAEAVVKVQRDFGNREDRKIARMKYLIADRGVEWFRGKVEEYFGEKLADCTADDVVEHNDHMGWSNQGDGKSFYGFNVENGRLFDSDNRKWKAALREICTTIRPTIRLTAHQSLLFCDLDESDRSRLESIILKNHLPLTADISNARRWSIACVALPTCGLAITESERVMPSLIDTLEQTLAELDLQDEQIVSRMTGCPNGCARPYNAEIGLVGKAKGKYTLYLGGSRLGTRLAFIHKDMVPLEEIVPTVRPILAAFKTERQPSESFGDYCSRVGNDRLSEIAASA